MHAFALIKIASSENAEEHPCWPVGEIIFRIKPAQSNRQKIQNKSNEKNIFNFFSDQ